jgi:hypothetical protein
VLGITARCAAVDDFDGEAGQACGRPDAIVVLLSSYVVVELGQFFLHHIPGATIGSGGAKPILCRVSARR